MTDQTKQTPKTPAERDYARMLKLTKRILEQPITRQDAVEGTFVTVAQRNMPKV